MFTPCKVSRPIVMSIHSRLAIASHRMSGKLIRRLKQKKDTLGLNCGYEGASQTKCKRSDAPNSFVGFARNSCVLPRGLYIQRRTSQPIVATDHPGLRFQPATRVAQPAIRRWGGRSTTARCSPPGYGTSDRHNGGYPGGRMPNGSDGFRCWCAQAGDSGPPASRNSERPLWRAPSGKNRPRPCENPLNEDKIRRSRD